MTNKNESKNMRENNDFGNACVCGFDNFILLLKK